MTEAVKTLVAKGADIALPCGNGWTPITLAADSGHLPIVQILLDNGADVNSTCNNGWTPLTLAAGAGNVAMIELLLSHGATIKATNDSGWSSLLIAADRGHTEVVAALLARGADVSTKNRGGLTALHAASENGNVDVAELLLARGADAAVGNKSGWNAVHVAAHNNHSQLIDLFLRTPGVSLNLRDNNGRTASYHAAMRGNADIVDLFLAKQISLGIPDSWGSEPIFSAVRNGHEAVARRLLAAGLYTSIDHVDGFGRDLLWWAQRSGRLGLLNLVRQHMRTHSPDLKMNDDMEPEEHPVKFVEDACWCEVCTRCTVLGTTSYECPTCDGGYFLVCAECYDSGVRCRDSSHELVPHSCNRVA
jgi:ankyrin repeat protein